MSNELASNSDLFVFSDHASSEEQTDAVTEVRDFIKTISGFRNIIIIERDKNYGLAKSIIEGVTTVINQYGRLIVIEDDLIVTPRFLEYMNQALIKYKSESKVLQISGYMFPVDTSCDTDALFMPLTTSWGWATWKRAWDLFDPDAKSYEKLKSDPNLRERFNLNGNYDYFSMLEKQIASETDSWAIRWYLSVFLRNGLVLYPKNSLVMNTGMDGSGRHGSIDGVLSNSLLSNLEIRDYPKEIEISESFNSIIKQINKITSKKNYIRRILGKFRH